eukprot:365884-Chlamydomonas_euryale.AAC.5
MNQPPPPCAPHVDPGAPHVDPCSVWIQEHRRVSHALPPTSPCTVPPQGRPTYRPRALFVDVGGALGGLRFGGPGGDGGGGGGLGRGAAQGAAPQVPTWQGRSEVHAAEPVPPSRFVDALQRGAALGDDASEDALEAYQVWGGGVEVCRCGGRVWMCGSGNTGKQAPRA